VTLLTAAPAALAENSAALAARRTVFTENEVVFTDFAAALAASSTVSADNRVPIGVRMNRKGAAL